MSLSRDSVGKRSEDEFCLDFDGTGFEERTGAHLGDQDERRRLVAEVDFDPRAPSLSRDLSKAFGKPRRLNAFLGHPMTGLNTEQVSRCQKVNRSITQTLETSLDPAFNVYNPADEFDPNGDCSGTYHDDERMVFWADLLIANHLYYADGVGMLVNQAAPHGIPIISIVPRSRELSPLYDGLPVRTWRQVVYSSLDELQFKMLDAVVDVIRDVRARSNQREQVNQLSGGDPGRELCTYRISQGISLEDLSERTGLSARALFQIEHDPNAFLRLPHAMVWTISQALGTEVVIQSHHTTFRLPERTDASKEDFVQNSLSNLIDFVYRDGDAAVHCQTEDAAACRSWNDYVEMVLSHATRESPRPGQAETFRDVLDCNEWRGRVEYYKSRLL